MINDMRNGKGESMGRGVLPRVLPPPPPQPTQPPQGGSGVGKGGLKRENRINIYIFIR